MLFDLDGTLVDPAGGITGGIAYALRAIALPVPPDEVLAAMVGPKLSDSLLAWTAATVEQLPELIGIYRRWYAREGIAMGRVYPGVISVLDELSSRGVPLGVATQKPQGLAETVLRAHGLDGYFVHIFGSSDDETLLPGDPGYRSGKAGIIAAAVGALGVEALGVEALGAGVPGATAVGTQAALSGTGVPGRPVMVGDRDQDVLGAAANSLACVGVQWGFALDGELLAAGAAAVVADAPALLAELNERLVQFADR